MPKRKPVGPWHEVLEPAPGGLHVVQAFLNSLDRLRGLDELASPRALNDWLRRWGLAGRDLELTDADLERVRTAREALRALVRSNHRKGHNETAAARLDRVAQQTPIRVRFAADGTTRLDKASDDLNGALGQILGHVAQAQADGSWALFKICPGKDCGRAFYDASKTHNRRWCSMKVCGGRSKSRTFRRRHPDYFRIRDF